MKTNLKNFPDLGKITMSHEELCEILFKVADWKDVFEQEIREIIAHFDEVLKKNPDNYYATWKKNCYLAILGEA